MIDPLYDILAKIGYIHPIHPPLTHVPIGAVMIGFCLIISSILRKRPEFLTSAYHAVVVGFILLIPTVMLGILDWQHYYSGAWIFPIKMKFGLACVLFLLLSAMLVVGRMPHKKPRIMLLLSTLSLLDVMGLGYFGGELVYASRVPTVEKNFLSGQKVFVNHCSGCHVNGGNIFFPDLPLHSAPQLKSYTTFIQFVRDPRLPNGLKSYMPDFTEAKLSEQQARELYDYLTQSQHFKQQPTDCEKIKCN